MWTALRNFEFWEGHTSNWRTFHLFGERPNDGSESLYLHVGRVKNKAFTIAGIHVEEHVAYHYIISDGDEPEYNDLSVSRDVALKLIRMASSNIVRACFTVTVQTCNGQAHQEGREVEEHYVGAYISEKRAKEAADLMQTCVKCKDWPYYFPRCESEITRVDIHK